MERINKRRKPNNYHEDNAHCSGPSFREHGENSLWRSQTTNQHSGQGVQNVNGQFHNGRDFSGIIHCPELYRPHAKTCQWFLKTPEYLDWLDINKFESHGGLLWVKGKPGVGKSTLMNFTFSRVRQKLKKKGEIVISFFFNARGEDLERTTVGLYRSLVLQLFEARPDSPDLQDILDNFPESEWTIESLQNLFEETVLAIGEVSIVCFIDALDECDEQEIRSMLSFLRSTSEQAASNKTRFRICLASRHYPHITMPKCLNLIIEKQAEHDQDITKYLDTELHIGHGEIAKKVRSDLQEKSSSIFMWVVLVVGILNKEYDRGRIHNLPETLRRVPSDLHALFRDILTRDDDNGQGLLLCIQWVLFARRPLSPVELYLAIVSGLEPGKLSEYHQKQERTSTDDIRRYILDNSKGLAELANSEPPIVQFIHESVRDFLLKEKGLQDIWPDLGPNFHGQSHEELKLCCLTYLRNDIVLNYDLPNPLPKASSSETKTLRQQVAERFGFLEYANHNILYHAEKAQCEEIHQSDFLSSISLDNLIKFSNLFENYDTRRHTSKVSLLYILAESNLPALIRAHASPQSCFDVEKERYGTPIIAALATGSEEAVKVLLELEAKDEPPESELHALCKRRTEIRDKSNRSRRAFRYAREKGVVYNVVTGGDEIVLKFLFARNKPNEKDLSLALDKVGRTSLYVAASNGHIDIVRLLLDNGAKIDDPNGFGRTPLMKAAERLHEDVARLLLDRGANIGSRDKNGDTPLHLSTPEL
ncbi:hypothetical protein F4818DRAFT_447956 [Hypoxylon cercidicola]|nr:hypothetical protein F4818DRAFT_447956 [Hypoxylon cercidicola]